VLRAALLRLDPDRVTPANDPHEPALCPDSLASPAQPGPVCEPFAIRNRVELASLDLALGADGTGKRNARPHCCGRASQYTREIYGAGIPKA